MKVVHICLCGPVTDGWSYQDNLLTKYQQKLGYDVTIVTSQWIWTTNGTLGKDNRKDYINPDGIRTIRLPMKGKDDFGKKFKRFFGLYETLENLHPDILFIHGVASLDNKTLVRYLKNHAEVVAFADNHADRSNSATNWISENILHKVIWKHYVRLLAPYIKKFYGVLPVRVDFLTEIYGLPADKCELLVMGADDELVEKAEAPQVREQIRKKYNIGEHDFLIMTGGKIDAWKTQTLLLMEAVHQIKDARVKLLVFGSVAQELKEKVTELADGKKVQYIGWVNSDDSYPLFASADLVCFPGRHSVFWEQVAGQGIPMMVKDWPGTHHIDLGGNAIFLRQDSTEEIKHNIEKLIRDPQSYDEMKKIAQEKGRTVFRYKAIAQKSLKEC